MNIALFGGTFDPIHSGHLQAARAATRRFRLDRVLFIPAGSPPHKRRVRLTPYVHRYAMVALACAGEPKFVPSLLESPRPDGRLHYSVETARAVSKSLRPDDRLFFLLGLDAFLDVPQWKSPERLAALAEFIVVSRPGFRIEQVLAAMPAHFVNGGRRRGAIIRERLHVLDGVNVPASSTGIRQALAQGRSVTGLIPRLVEEYILKAEFYKPKTRRGSYA